MVWWRTSWLLLLAAGAGCEAGGWCAWEGVWVRGGAGAGWRVAAVQAGRGEPCGVFAPDYRVRVVEHNGTHARLRAEAPCGADLRLCTAPSPQGAWTHVGPLQVPQPIRMIQEDGDQQTVLQEAQTAESDLAGEIKVTERKDNLIDTESNNDEVNLLTKNDDWIDLSHDIDVNNDPRGPRLTRDEANDILVRTEVDQYVPLSETHSDFIDTSEEDNSIQNLEIDNIQDSTNYNGLGIKLPEVNAYAREIEELGADFKDMEPVNEELIRRKRQDNLSSVRAEVTNIAKIEGLRIDGYTKTPENDDGVPSVLAHTKVTMRVFGSNLNEKTLLQFTHDEADYGTNCDYPLKGQHAVVPGSVTAKSALFEFIAPAPVMNSTFYLCIKDGAQSDPTARFIHQGTDKWVRLATHNKTLPLWATLCLILVCLMFSALFSGLNLGLMSLDRTELKIIANTGTETERKYARAIQPVRDHGNYLLCSILLGNVAVNSTFTILLDDLMSGLFAVIFSTLAIVCLGEIVPQAICSRHGLMIGAKSIVVTKAVMGMTAPLAYPVSKMLDYFLGEEIGNVYNRERLKELVKVTNDINDLDKDEVNIISGALELRKKTVFEVMTKIEDVFMLSMESILDFETMSEIVKSGYSRIPVYDGTRTNIVTVLFIKDLAFVDPDDNTPLKTLCQFYQNPCTFVFEDTTLDVMFRQFKEGHKGHMAFVRRVNSEGEGDPFYETIGLVTLEDVIEELIQAEIVDETDVFMDNRSKRKRIRATNAAKLQDFAAFAERRENQRIRISPQLTLATFQFLTSTVDAFRPDFVSETVLRRLLRQDIIHQIKCKGKDKKDPSTLVYTQGKPVDYFVLILEGRVEVTVGRENLVFEAGPFTYFGVQALTQNVGVAESPTPSTMGSLQNINMDAMLRYTFVPDYSVRAITEVFYITVKRSLYLAAKRATLMEKTSSLTKGGATLAGEQFDNEVDKLLQSLDEDGSISGDHHHAARTPSRQVSPNLPPSSASHQTRSAFASPSSGSPTRSVPRASTSQHNNGDITYKFPPGQQIETEEEK